MLILKECAERGMIVMTNNGWDLAPGAKELAKFLNVERQALQTIGMERRPKPLPCLADLLDDEDSPETTAQNGGN